MRYGEESTVPMFTITAVELREMAERRIKSIAETKAEMEKVNGEIDGDLTGSIQEMIILDEQARFLRTHITDGSFQVTGAQLLSIQGALSPVQIDVRRLAAMASSQSLRKAGEDKVESLGGLRPRF